MQDEGGGGLSCGKRGGEVMTLSEYILVVLLCAFLVFLIYRVVLDPIWDMQQRLGVIEGELDLSGEHNEN